VFKAFIMLVFTAYMIYRYFFTRNPLNLFLILFQTSAAILALIRYTIQRNTEMELYSILIFLSIVLPMIILFYDAMNGLSPGTKNKYKYHRFYSKEIGIDVNEISKPYPARISKVILKDKVNSVFLKAAYEAVRTKEYDKAQYIYQTMLDNRIKDPVTYFNLAYAFYHQNQYKDALLLFLRSAVCAKRKLRKNKVGRKLISRAYYNAGNCLFKLEKFKKACRFYVKSNEYDTSNFAAKENLVISKIASGFVEEAYDDYMLMLTELDNKAFSHNLHVFMGKAYEQINKYHEALCAYGKAKDIRRNSDIMHHIAKLLYNISRYDEAANEYNEIIKLYPENKKAFLGLGLSLYKLGKLHEAKTAFSNILDMDEAKYNYLLISYKLNDLKQTLPVIRKMLLTEQTSKEYRLCAAIYMKLGKYYDASGVYRSAIEIDPDDHKLYYETGVAYTYQKDHFSAARYYKKAMLKSPDNVLYASALLKTYLDTGMRNRAYELYKMYDDTFKQDKTWTNLTTLI
jgi:tetratricopeptide (TPR) repeat protein